MVKEIFHSEASQALSKMVYFHFKLMDMGDGRRSMEAQKKVLLYKGTKVFSRVHLRKFMYKIKSVWRHYLNKDSPQEAKHQDM